MYRPATEALSTLAGSSDVAPRRHSRGGLGG
jgi:hypothetical protein